MLGPSETLGLRVALGLAIGGTLVILSGLFGSAISVAALVAVVLGTVMAAPAAPARGWWGLLAAGALISAAGAAIALGSQELGGLLAVIGGVLVLIGASLGYPLGRTPA